MEVLLLLIIFAATQFVKIKARENAKAFSQQKPAQQRPVQQSLRRNTAPKPAPAALKSNFEQIMKDLDKKISALEQTGKELRGAAPQGSLEMQEQPDYVEDTRPVPLVSNPPVPQITGSIEGGSSEGIGTEGLGEYRTLYEDTFSAPKITKNPLLPDFSGQNLVKSFILSEILKPRYRDEA